MGHLSHRFKNIDELELVDSPLKNFEKRLCGKNHLVILAKKFPEFCRLKDFDFKSVLDRVQNSLSN